MISYLKGGVIEKQEKYMTLVTNGAVGYRVHATGSSLERISIGEEVAFFIHTHVREDALDLYGFPTSEELDFFEQLISISGVGPKSALGVLAIAPLEDVKKAIIHGDPTLLQKVSAIGKKTAERIIIELKEKITVGNKDDGGASITDSVNLLDALSSLGYKDHEIRSALKLIPADKKDLSEKIKEALRILSNH